MVYSCGLERIKVEALDNTRPDSQVPLYYLHDGLGSTKQLVRANGAVRDHYNYDEFGDTVGAKLSEDGRNVNHNTFGYTGELWDEEDDLLYLRSRYYAPQIGRFMTRDTFPGYAVNPLSIHKYAYVENDPVNFVDPLGFEKNNSITLTESEKKLGIKVATINGNQYYYYSQVINDMLLKNARTCFDRRLKTYEDYLEDTWYMGEYDQWFAGIYGTMLWYKDQVNHNAPWDIKRKARWEEQLPGVKYLGVDGKFVLYGELITSEDLGNITYGYWGSAVGFGDVTLYWGGGAAKLGMFDPETKKPPYYGDDVNDHWMIKKGIDWFNKAYPNYKTVYNGIPVP